MASARVTRWPGSGDWLVMTALGSMEGGAGDVGRRFRAGRWGRRGRGAGALSGSDELAMCSPAVARWLDAA